MIKTIIAVCMLSTCSVLNARLITPKDIDLFAKDTTVGIKALLDVKTIDPKDISMEEASKYFRSFEKFCAEAIKDGKKDYLSYLAAYPLRDTAFETIIKVQLNNLYFDEIIKSEDFKNRVKQAREKREETIEEERKNKKEITFKDGNFHFGGKTIAKNLVEAAIQKGGYGDLTFSNPEGMRSLYESLTRDEIITAPIFNFAPPPLNFAPPPQTGGGSNNRANLMTELENSNPIARLKKTVTVEKGGVNPSGNNKNDPEKPRELSFMEALKAKVKRRFDILNMGQEKSDDDQVVVPAENPIKQEEPKIPEPKKEEVVKIETRPEAEEVRESLKQMMDSILQCATPLLEQQGYFSMEDLDSLFMHGHEEEDKRELSQKEKDFIDERLSTVFKYAIEQTVVKGFGKDKKQSKLEVSSINSENEINNLNNSLTNPDLGDSMKKITNGIVNLATANGILKHKLDFICSACDAVVEYEGKDANEKQTDLKACKQVIKNLLKTMKKNIEFAQNLLPPQCLNKNKTLFDKLYKAEGTGINTKYEIKDEEIKIGEFEANTKTIAYNIADIYSYKDFYNKKINDPITEDLKLPKIN